MVDKSPAVQKPAWGRVLPPNERPIPPGVDYADEVLGKGTVAPAIGDPINTTVGSNSYIANPGRSWLPWAIKPAAHPMGLPEPVPFTRYYPTLRLCVDVHPSKQNLDAVAQSELADQNAFKYELCKTHGTGYVALHVDEEVDLRMFTLALEIGSKPRSEESVGVASGITMDVLDPPYYMNAGIAQLPWAYRTVLGQKDAIVFSRYYFTLALCVDLYPDRQFMTPQERSTAEVEIAARTALCQANTDPPVVDYLAVFGLESLEAALATRQSSGREPPVPEPASDEPDEFMDTRIQPPPPRHPFKRKREPEF